MEESRNQRRRGKPLRKHRKESIAAALRVGRLDRPAQENRTDLRRKHKLLITIYMYIHTYIYYLVRCRTSSVFSEKIFVYLLSGE